MSKKNKKNDKNKDVREKGATDNKTGNNNTTTGAPQTVQAPDLQEEKRKRHHDNLRKEEGHRWPKQM
jgi:hypothetical protein